MERIQFLVEGGLFGSRAQTANFVLQGHVVTLEITSGVVYRGKLLEGVLGSQLNNLDSDKTQSPSPNITMYQDNS